MIETSAWKQVWERRSVDTTSGFGLTPLLAADGYDSSFGAMDETAWVAFVHRIANRLGIAAGMSVFEVGCGAGAFLYELSRMGCMVSGVDQSAALVHIAQQAMPEGDFAVADAAQVDTRQPVDVVVSCSVFLYFASYGYARAVIRGMAVKACRAVAVLDVPDLATMEASRRFRAESTGDPAAYAARYQGLDHLYYDRTWFHEELLGVGFTDVQVTDQDLVGYGNAPFRFNALAFKRTPLQRSWAPTSTPPATQKGHDPT
jgi:SAM-dependent methyltransferase